MALPYSKKSLIPVPQITSNLLIIRPKILCFINVFWKFISIKSIILKLHYLQIIDHHFLSLISYSYLIPPKPLIPVSQFTSNFLMFRPNILYPIIKSKNSVIPQIHKIQYASIPINLSPNSLLNSRITDLNINSVQIINILPITYKKIYTWYLQVLSFNINRTRKSITVFALRFSYNAPRTHEVGCVASATWRGTCSIHRKAPWQKPILWVWS